MCNIEATTPQLKAVKDFLDAYISLDVNNVAQHISKNYKFQTFPKIAEHPEEEQGAHFQRYGAILSSVKKLELKIHEAIEAPGKVVVHLSGVFHPVDGPTLDYDSLAILTLVEEDGQLKVVDFKDFSDPEKRNKLHGWVAQALAKSSPLT